VQQKVYGGNGFTVLVRMKSSSVIVFLELALSVCVIFVDAQLNLLPVSVFPGGWSCSLSL